MLEDESKDIAIDNEGPRPELQSGKNEINGLHGDASLQKVHSDDKTDNESDKISKGLKIKLEIDCERNAKRLKIDEISKITKEELEEPKLVEQVVPNVNEGMVKKEDNAVENREEPMDTTKESDNIIRSPTEKGQNSADIVNSISGNVEINMKNDILNVPNDNARSDASIITEVKVKAQESGTIVKSPSGNDKIKAENDVLKVPIDVESVNSDVTDVSIIIGEVKAKNQAKSEEELSKPPVKTPCEVDCGITEFIGKHTGFRAILKHRYSDFIVNEITPEGEVVKLTSFAIPVDMAPNVSKDILKSLLPADTVEKIETLSKGSDLDDILIDANAIDKEKRTEIHLCIKENYQTLTSTTDVVNDKRTIRIRPVSLIKKAERQNWPRGRPNFTHFVMYKENCDTSDAINTIGSMLNIKSGVLNYAGTKDKRGKTSQMVSIKRVKAERLISLNNGMRNISVGNFIYKESSLKLGLLAGNRFTIILREIDSLNDEILMGLFSLKDKGFINYYGMQRFGTTEVSTHQVGRALILANWQDAINLILKPRSGDSQDMHMCRKIWTETKNASKAFHALYNKGCIEGQLLRGLIDHKPKDLVNALNNIPRNMRLMYIHAYQSYLFNAVASKRITKYGLEPIVGDLYVPAQNKDSKEDSVVGDKLKLEKDEKPKIITQDDIDQKKFSIYDVVLPLPGTCVIYPENEAMEWFKEILKQDGLDLNSFTSKVRVYSLSGSYRHVLVKPKNMSWSFLTYHKRDEDLCLGDWDILKGKELTLDKTGKFKALKLSLDLPSSSYATMAIREVTKKDTAVLSQKY